MAESENSTTSNSGQQSPLASSNTSNKNLRSSVSKVTTTPKTTNQSTLNDHFKKATGTNSLELDNNFEYDADKSIYSEFTMVPAKGSKVKQDDRTNKLKATEKTPSASTTLNQFEPLSDSSEEDEDWIGPNHKEIIASPPTNCDPASILPHTKRFKEQHIACNTRSHKVQSKQRTDSYLSTLHEANEANNRRNIKWTQEQSALLSNNKTNKEHETSTLDRIKNNQIVYSEKIIPPDNGPLQKSYKPPFMTMTSLRQPSTSLDKAASAERKNILDSCKLPPSTTILPKNNPPVSKTSSNLTTSEPSQTSEFVNNIIKSIKNSTNATIPADQTTKPTDESHKMEVDPPPDPTEKATTSTEPMQMAEACNAAQGVPQS